MRADRPVQHISWLAVASFAFMILLFLSLLLEQFARNGPNVDPDFVWPGYFAVVFGILAVIHIRLKPQQRKGMLLTVASTLVSASLVTCVHVQDHYFQKRMRGVSCLNNMKQIGTAMNMYEADHRGRLPSLEHWNEAVLRYAKNKRIMVCPSARDEGLPGYAMNARLRSLDKHDIADPAGTVMVFESAPGRNRFGGPELLLPTPRHPRWYNILFCDGRAKRVWDSQIRHLNWDPKTAE